MAERERLTVREFDGLLAEARLLRSDAQDPWLAGGGESLPGGRAHLAHAARQRTDERSRPLLGAPRRRNGRAGCWLMRLALWTKIAAADDARRAGRGAAAAALLSERVFAAKAEINIRSRAELLAEAIHHAAEIGGESEDLVRIVNSLGGERDVRLIVVSGRQRILASTRNAWIGKPVSYVAEDVAAPDQRGHRGAPAGRALRRRSRRLRIRSAARAQRPAALGHLRRRRAGGGARRHADPPPAPGRGAPAGGIPGPRRPRHDRP